MSILYGICRFHFVCDKLCVSFILNGLPFDVFSSSFQTTILFYFKRSFYVVLISLKLPLYHATIAWFSAYNKDPLAKRVDLHFKIIINLFSAFCPVLAI